MKTALPEVVIVDAYAWPAIAGTILFNRVLAPHLLGREPDKAAIAEALPRARLCLAEIERLMEGHHFLAADFVTLTDIMAAPLLYAFGNSPDGKAPFAEHPELAEWIKRLEARQSFQVTKPNW